MDDAAQNSLTRTALLVLGMHRGGTSLVGRSLHALGVALPQTLIGAAQSNSLGHYESHRVRQFNDRLLTACNSGWSDWGPVRFDALSHDQYQQFLQEAVALAGEEFGTAPQVVLKDPRISRMVPFWLDALEAGGRSVRVVLALRNPLEVAASLEARDGFVQEYSHFLWLRHMLEAEAATRDRPRGILSFDALINDWAGSTTALGHSLGLSWTVPPQKAAHNDPPALRDLRHHWHDTQSVLAAPGLNPWLAEAYRVFEGWARLGTDVPPDRLAREGAILDDLRARLDAATPVFDPLIQQGHRTMRQLTSSKRRTKALLQEQAEHQALSAEQAAQATLASAETARLQASLATAQSANAALRAQAQEAQRTAHLARQQRDDLAAILRALMIPRQKSRWYTRFGQLRRDIAAVAATGLFDPAWYLKTNPDVAKAGVDPLQHFVRNGLSERRAPRGPVQTNKGQPR